MFPCQSVKVALKKYIQATLSLPVKDPDEITAFFTSDLVRVRHPVALAGCGEGYLTKQDINSGGWQRRYFFIQGSQLEYYKSVWLPA